jgi:hypothetical protein
MNRKENLYIKNEFYSIDLFFIFPLKIGDIDSSIDVSLNIDGVFTFFSYIVKTQHVNIERIDYNPQKELNVNKIIENISDIFKNNLTTIGDIPIKIEQIENNIYKYDFTLKKEENCIDNFKYRLQIERYRIDNGSTDFDISISFGTNEKINNIEEILKITKLILENMDTIEKEIKNKIKEIIINKIENIK